MSILNAFVRDDVALVGVDTEGALANGRYVESCKVVILPHINAMVGFRGSALMLQLVASSLMAFLGNFDELAETMPTVIRDALPVAIDHAERLGLTRDEVEKCNFVIVGYSPREQRMSGHFYDKQASSPEVSHGVDFPYAIMPGWGDKEDLENIAAIDFDREGMVALARYQFRRVREREPAGLPAGGRFFITELRKDSISTSPAFQFPPR